MTLYLTLSGLLGTAQGVLHAVSFLIGAARTWWRAQEASRSPPTTWTTFKAAFLEAFQTLDAERIARDNMENLRQRTSVTDYAKQSSGLLLEIPHMHPADAIYQFVKCLKAKIRLHVDLQRPSTVNDALRLTQAADSALYYTRPTYPFNRPTPPPAYMGPQPMQLGALTPLSPGERERLLRENKCFRCRQPGNRSTVHPQQHHAPNVILNTRATQRLAGQPDHTALAQICASRATPTSTTQTKTNQVQETSLLTRADWLR